VRLLFLSLAGRPAAGTNIALEVVCPAFPTPTFRQPFQLALIRGGYILKAINPAALSP